MSKLDLYKTAKIKDDSPIEGAGEFVALNGHINDTLVYTKRVGEADWRLLHKWHLERFCL